MKKPKLPEFKERSILSHLRHEAKLDFFVLPEEFQAYRDWLADVSARGKKRAAAMDRKTTAMIRKEIQREMDQDWQFALKHGLYTGAQSHSVELLDEGFAVFGRSPWQQRDRFGNPQAPDMIGEVWCRLADYWRFVASSQYAEWQASQREVAAYRSAQRLGYSF